MIRSVGNPIPNVQVTASNVEEGDYCNMEGDAKGEEKSSGDLVLCKPRSVLLLLLSLMTSKYFQRLPLINLFMDYRIFSLFPLKYFQGVDLLFTLH